MDILVSTPKAEIGNAAREGADVEQSGGYWFRVFRFRPDVNPGDRIYFVELGEIKGYGIVNV